MKGYIIKSTKGTEIWSGSCWIPANMAKYAKVYATQKGAEREMTYMDRARPGMQKMVAAEEVHMDTWGLKASMSDFWWTGRCWSTDASAAKAYKTERSANNAMKVLERTNPYWTTSAVAVKN